MTIINAGSENKGGTFEQALIAANEWLEMINEEYPEVTMTTHEDRLEDGDWNFKYTHGVTGKCVELQIHGYTVKECEGFMFSPRVYWNGSSTGGPKIEDWLDESYTYRIVYSKKENSK